MPNFLTVGNGIMRCYDMFPTQFKDIDEMTAYLPRLKEMGFNTVWCNPLQQAGNVENLYKRDKTTGVRSYNEVTRSLYAMTDPGKISPYFSVAKDEMDPRVAVEKDKAALHRFTDTARANAIVPIFDLVLNHVASDSEIRRLHPHWFNKEPHKDFKDCIAFDYSEETTRNEIVKEFWEPYIRRYMLEYGFDGVRVDAVGYIHPDVRRQVYEIINRVAKEKGLEAPIILDEALFSSSSVADTVKSLLLPTVGPTHITRSTYYAHRNEFGGLDEWHNHEEGVKAQVVFLDDQYQLRSDAKGGCISFSGNHDHNSLAMTVIEEMAHERLNRHPVLSEQLQLQRKPVDEAIHSVFLYSFIDDIKREIAAGDRSTINCVEKKMRDKIAICSLTSSGGWYALSGDEFGDVLAKPVFRRRNALDQSYYPQQKHIIFEGEHQAVALDVVIEMAIQNIQQEKVAGVFSSLSGHKEAQKRLLAPYIETLKQQINSGDTVVCDEFQRRMESAGVAVTFNKDDFVQVPRFAGNGWNGQHDMRGYISNINRLLSELPASKLGFWSELISIPSKPELAIVVRKNGQGLSAETDIAIANLSGNPITLTEKEIHEIACNFQQRVIPEHARHEGNPDYNLAYQSVMACINSGRIHTDDTITTAFSGTPKAIQTTRESRVEMEQIRTAVQGDSIPDESASVEVGVVKLPSKTTIVK